MCECLIKLFTSIVAAAIFLGTIAYLAYRQTLTDPLFNYANKVVNDTVTNSTLT